MDPKYAKKQTSKISAHWRYKVDAKRLARVGRTSSVKCLPHYSKSGRRSFGDYVHLMLSLGLSAQLRLSIGALSARLGSPESWHPGDYTTGFACIMTHPGPLSYASSTFYVFLLRVRL